MRAAASLLGRIQRLETRLADGTGLVPQSEGWFAYWENILDRLLAGEEPVFHGPIPLDVTDRLIANADREDGLIA